MEHAGSVGPTNGSPSEKVWEPLYDFFCLDCKDCEICCIFIMCASTGLSSLP